MSLNRVCGKLQRCQTLGSKRKTKKKNGKCSTHCRSCVNPCILQTTHNWTLSVLCSFFVPCFFNTYYCCCNSNFVHLLTWSFIMATRGETLIERSLTTGFLLLSLAGLLPLFLLIVFCIVP